MEKFSGKQIYSLLQISTEIRKVIQTTFPDYLWITAEIAKLNFYPKSGHCYPDLVEKEHGRVKAQIRANIWSSNFSQINNKFKTVTGVALKDGMKILFLGKVTFHEQYGLALNILDVEPSFTLGEMAREKKETIDRLKKEGLFELNKQKKIALLPKRVAVISVETSKGYHDFINILDKNPWKYRFSVTLFPALLQGDGAVKSIAAQLETISDSPEDFDVIAIIRGGGGDVGLNAYDNYSLSKAVATADLPVIAGIGHSTNETVVQMVAFANKITPTEAAHFLIQQFHNFAYRLETAAESLIRTSQNVLLHENRRIEQNLKIFQLSSQNSIEKEKKVLITTSQFFKQRISFLLKNAFRQIDLLTVQIKKDIRNNVENTHWTVERKNQKIINGAHQLLMKKQHQIKLLEKQLELLSPDNILKRGYSITYYNGKAITEASNLNVGVKLKTELYKGKLNVKIEKIIK